MASNVQYTREQVITYLKDLIAIKGVAPTRDNFREESDIPERAWRRYFPSYTDYVAAAAQEDELDSQVFEQDTWTINIPKTRIHTVEEIIEKYKIDLSIWKLERFKVGNYELGMKPPATTEYVEGKDGRVVPMWVRFEKEPVITPLYRIEASFIRNKALIDVRKEINDLKAELSAGYHPAKNTILTNDINNGNMLEINIPDAHFGKMAWGVETGDRPYDTPIAAATFMRALENLIKRSENYKYEKILFIVGNDLLNSDNEQGTTTKGTAVSTDGRYQKTFLTVRKTITEAIHRLKQIAPVHVVMVSGNHDDLSVWHLGESLECLFQDDSNVLIDNKPTARKYIRHGNVLLMLTHGDKGKREDYPLLMATERSKDFGETKYREIHTGHIHQTKTQEWHGVRVRILPSLSPPDAWHSENGFTGQQRNAEAYVWNNREGLIAQFFHNDDCQTEITTDRILKES